MMPTTNSRKQSHEQQAERQVEGKGPAMDDRIRASDADRERVTARLRDHYAEGRLTSEELDERTSAALHAKTFGDLRRVMTDLPDPVLVPQGAPGLRPSGPSWMARRRGPRFLPVAMVLLLVALLAPGPGWVLFAFFKVVLLFWLVTGLVSFLFARRFRHRMPGGPGGYSSGM
jgi:hypothetical protein